MRSGLRTLAIVTMVATAFALAGCKSEPSSMPPNPTALINNTRDRLSPFRFTLTTDPAPAKSNSSILLKVHVIDAANQPADGVTVKADVSMSGTGGAHQVTLDGRGDGNYEGQVSLEMGGSWDVDLTATRDGKSSQQKLSIDVGS